MSLFRLFRSAPQETSDDVLDEVKTAIAARCGCFFGGCVHDRIRRLVEAEVDKERVKNANWLAYVEVMEKSAADLTADRPEGHEPIMTALDRLAELRRLGVEDLKRQLAEANQKVDHVSQIFDEAFHGKEEMTRLVEAQRQTLTDAFSALNDTKGDLNAKQADVLAIQKKLDDFEQRLGDLAESIQEEIDALSGGPDHAERATALVDVVTRLNLIREEVPNAKVSGE